MIGVRARMTCGSFSQQEAGGESRGKPTKKLDIMLTVSWNSGGRMLSSVNQTYQLALSEA
jgi:hypothetical protein